MKPLRKFYAYRHNETGTDSFKDARPYCTKGAAYGGVIKHQRTVNLTPEEQRVARLVNGHARAWRYRSPEELKAFVAANYTLIEYELHEVGPVGG